MAISYGPLWKTMKEKQISQYTLINHYGISSSQMHRLHKDSYVSTHTIDLLCEILNCRVEDVMERVEKADDGVAREIRELLDKNGKRIMYSK